MEPVSVLLIEDNLADQRLIIEMLKEFRFLKYLFFSSETLSNGLEKLKNNKIDIILLDLNLPDSNGKQTFDSVMFYAKDVPVVLVSGLEDAELSIKLIREGAQDFVTKQNLNSQILEKTIKYSIERKNNERELENYKIHLEELVKNRTEELEIANKTKDKFFSIIAHDLKNPFAGLLSSCELLKRSIVKQDMCKIEKHTDSIYNSSKRAYTLLDDLLNWSRLQMGKCKEKKERFNINSIINETITNLQNFADVKEIEIAISGNETYETFFDIEMFKTIIRNLTSNAIKYSQKGSKVIVEITEFNEKQYKIAIKDFGVGICEANIQRLFNLNSSYTTYGTANEKGTGLGLILCKEFAEKNGSEIRVESEENNGSTFSFIVEKIK